MTTRLVESEWIWHEGHFIPWREARIHLLTLAVQFGSSIFEGIRCYETPEGLAIFRLDAHLHRLFDSCRIYRMEPRPTFEELTDACIQLIVRNDHGSCYIRPMVLRGYGSAGLNPVGSPVETYLASWPWGAYLGADALEQGVDVCVSSWRRPYPNTYPVASKSAGHYNNAQLIKMEAIANGFAEAIVLGPGGLVSEGSGQNIFLVRQGILITPSTDATFLAGITRDTVLTLARELGIPVREESVPRESLYTAEEIFFTGTATEVTPVRSVDRIPVGTGKVGPVTRELQHRFLETVSGRLPDNHGWLTPVPLVTTTGTS
jgi:branched-chain amino acid aminotransferase